jgi:hypothetical protein
MYEARTGVLLRLRYGVRRVNDFMFVSVRYGYPLIMELLLWILAVVLVVAGVLALFRKQVLWGVVLIIVGLLVGPGGVSIFT